MSITQLVGAKELPTVEVHEGFSLVRKEVESGGVVELGQMVENEEWERILEFTKLYDLSFRKLTLKQVIRLSSTLLNPSTIYSSSF